MPQYPPKVYSGDVETDSRDLEAPAPKNLQSSGLRRLWSALKLTVLRGAVPQDRG